MLRAALSYLTLPASYWTETIGGHIDMWFTDHPAFGFNGTTPVDAPIGPEIDYEEYKFAQRAYTVRGEGETGLASGYTFISSCLVVYSSHMIWGRF
jgi:hypothetical protein